MKDGKAVEPDVLIELAEAQIRLGKNREAGEHVAKYLETARDPRRSRRRLAGERRGSRCRAGILPAPRKMAEGGQSFFSPRAVSTPRAGC